MWKSKKSVLIIQSLRGSDGAGENANKTGTNELDAEK